ncbi:MAG: prolyl oligopeptidase family serine peptidase, partial [Polyangiaceae bacterium]
MTVKETLAFVLLLALHGCGGEALRPSPSPPVLATHPPQEPMTSSPASPSMVHAFDYPESRRVDQVDTIHGITVADPYRWLEDSSSAEVRAWSAAEDKLARSILSALPDRDALAARFKELFYVESMGAPQRLGGRWFFPRRDAGKEKSTVYWREGRYGADKVLLDPNTWSSDGSMSLGVWSVSYDGQTVAYAVKGNNSDEATLYVMDVATGRKREIDVIEGAKYAWPSWTPTGDGFYYTALPPEGSVATSERPGYAEVRFHKLGSDPKADRLVHERTGDPKTFLGAALSRDGRWLVVTVEHGWTSTDVYFQDLSVAKPEWRPLVVGQDARYDVSVDRGRFFVLTNEGAPKSRVFRVDPSHPDRDRWTEIVPERRDATLEAISIVGHCLSLAYLKDVVSHIEIRDEDGRLTRTIALPGIGSASALAGQPDDDLAYYSFQSFTYPTEIFETSVATGKTTSFYKLNVPVDPSAYVVEQSFATSPDGTRVPFFTVRPKNATKGGGAPTILYGYGGFQVAQAPFFSSSIFPWLEHGGMWVVANLRGGSEYGEAWHRQGMRREKQRVFDDYFAVAEELVRQGYTRADRLAAMGASNGG